MSLQDALPAGYGHADEIQSKCVKESESKEIHLNPVGHFESLAQRRFYDYGQTGK
jgi:hypothetical protein